MQLTSGGYCRTMGKDKEVIGYYLLIFVMLLFLTGCAADKAFHEGSTLMERGDYDEAIVKLTEAVELSEKDVIQGTMEQLGTTLGDTLSALRFIQQKRYGYENHKN